MRGPTTHVGFLFPFVFTRGLPESPENTSKSETGVVLRVALIHILLKLGTQRSLERDIIYFVMEGLFKEY